MLIGILNKLLVYISSKYVGIIIYFYMLALVLVPLLSFTLFWFWIGNINKIYVREKCRNFGLVCGLKNSMLQNTIIKNYVILQLNTISECFTGFTDGILQKNTAFKFIKPISVETQTDTVKLQVIIEEKFIEVPVEIIKEVEVIKEVIKEVEVVKEVIKEVEVIKEIYKDKSSKNNKDSIFEKIKSKDKQTSNKPNRITLRKKSQQIKNELLEK